MAFTVNVQVSLFSFQQLMTGNICLEGWNSVHCVLLDVAEVFDSVPYCRLLFKVECLGVKGKLS